MIIFYFDMNVMLQQLIYVEKLWKVIATHLLCHTIVVKSCWWYKNTWEEGLNQALDQFKVSAQEREGEEAR